MKPYTYRGLQVGCQTAKCKCTDKLNKQCSRAECMDVIVITFFENVGRCMCVCVCVTITLHSANYYCLFSLSVVFALAV